MGPVGREGSRMTVHLAALDFSAPIESVLHLAFQLRDLIASDERVSIELDVALHPH